MDNLFKFDARFVVNRLRDRLEGLQLLYLFGAHASDRATLESDVGLGFYRSIPVNPVVRYELAQDFAVELSCDVDKVYMAAAGDVVSKEIVENGLLLLGNPETAERFELSVYREYQARRHRVADLERDLLRL